MVTPEALRRAAELLVRLSRQEIRFWMEGDRLQCSAPAGAMADALRQDFRAEREALIALVGAAEADDVTLSRLERGGPPLATLAQETLLPLAPTRRVDGVYNVPVSLEFAGAVDLAILHAAMNALQTRHNTLRTHFPVASDKPALSARHARPRGDVAPSRRHPVLHLGAAGG